MSRRARSAYLTRYGMVAAEHLQCFTGRTHTTLLYVLKALPDSLKRIGFFREVGEAPLGLCLLPHRLRLFLCFYNKQVFCPLLMLHELPRIAPECCHRLSRGESRRSTSFLQLWTNRLTAVR